MLKVKKICLIFIMALFLSSCNLAGVIKNQKNIFGRYYDGALNEKDTKAFNNTLAKMYERMYKETNYKKPYIVGRCIADPILSNLPKDSYQSFADWKVFVISSKEVIINAIGNKLLIISDAAMDYFNYDQNVIGFFIAHVVAHSELDHLNERMGMSEYYVSKPLEAFTTNRDEYVDRVFSLAGGPSSPSHMIPYSEELENEADEMAMTLLGMAGYDPNNAFVYLNNHIDVEDPPFYLKQHPITQKRVDHIFSLLENTVSLRDRAFKLGAHPQCTNIQ